MNCDLVTIGWIILAAVTSAIPVAGVKQFLIKKEPIWIFISIISFCLVIYSYSKIFTNNKHEISSIYPLIKCLSIGLIVSIGLIAFNEDFSYKKCVGLALGVGSIYLLSH
jgi:multidrug transporter EmrE-like cation transporter